MLPYWTNPLDEDGNMDLFLLMEYFHWSIKKKELTLKKKKKRSKVEFRSKIVKRVPFALESMDAAPEVPHPHPTRLPACLIASTFFFFFYQIRADSARFTPMQLDSCQICFDLRRTGLIWSKLGRIGRWPILPKHAGNGRNRPWIWPEKPKLAFFFLFLWIKA